MDLLCNTFGALAIPDEPWMAPILDSPAGTKFASQGDDAEGGEGDEDEDRDEDEDENDEDGDDEDEGDGDEESED